VAEAPDRFCRNCGHELSPEDQFCPNCARPVHETATVPTPEADVPVPPPPQTTGGAGGAAAPQQPAQEGGGGRRWRPILVGSLGVFVVLVAAIISFVIGALYGKGLLGCNETAAEQKGPKGKIGQTVKFSNVAWQVTTVRQATQLKAPSYPKKKGNFVIVDFLFTNNADEATTLDSGSLTLIDGEGCEFEMQPNEFEYIDPVYIAPGKDIFSENAENVNPGVTQDGQVIFAVTPDAKDFTLRASDTDPFITDENAYIDLGI
jgi:hypothetical protein